MAATRSTSFLPHGPVPDPRGSSPGNAAEIVVVGAPLTATQAVAMFLVGLPEGFALPIVLVLGGAAEDYDEVTIGLQAHSALPVRQIDDKDPILGGRVHLAPADYHLLVEPGHFALSTEAPVHGARPSIDVLLESVADAFGAGAVCILLGSEGAGAGEGEVDGVAGAARVRARGGLVIVQNPATAAVGSANPSGAPGPGTVLHLSQIAPFVSHLGDLELT